VLRRSVQNRYAARTVSIGRRQTGYKYFRYRTVTVEQTLSNLVGLGLLVLIRTSISWTTILGEEGRWPRQPKREDEGVDD
jgi:hypothetical protein